jgi:transcriptional regulator with XRE-family HTH domain
METPYKRLREEAGLTQGELSALLGMATQQYQLYESGRRQGQTKTTVRIARALAEKLNRPAGEVLAELTQVDEKDQPQLETVA